MKNSVAITAWRQNIQGLRSWEGNRSFFIGVLRLIKKLKSEEKRDENARWEFSECFLSLSVFYSRLWVFLECVVCGNESTATFRRSKILFILFCFFFLFSAFSLNEKRSGKTLTPSHQSLFRIWFDYMLFSLSFARGENSLLVHCLYIFPHSILIYSEQACKS